MTTKVIHVKDAPADWRKQYDEFIYIGRGSLFGNPYRIDAPHPDTGAPMTRDDVCDLFAAYALQNIKREDLARLRGKTLVCYCKPERCHGDTLAQAADGLEEPRLVDRVTAIREILEAAGVDRVALWCLTGPMVNTFTDYGALLFYVDAGDEGDELEPLRQLLPLGEGIADVLDYFDEELFDEFVACDAQPAAGQEAVLSLTVKFYSAEELAELEIE